MMDGSVNVITFRKTKVISSYNFEQLMFAVYTKLYAQLVFKTAGEELK